MESKANLGRERERERGGERTRERWGGGREEALDVDTIQTSASSSSHLGLWSLGS